MEMTIKPGLILCCISFYMQIVSVFDCAASSNILVSNRAVLESVEGPYNPELFVTYPITIEIQNPDTVAFSFFLEYPFWGMVPAIESSSNAIIVNATEQIDENNIHIDVSCNFDLETDADALTITFSGTKRQFFDSIQFFYGYPPTPPIRQSPPIYPIWFRQISYSLSDQQLIHEPDSVTAFLITDYGLKLIVHVDITSIQGEEEMTLELVSVNDIPLPYQLKTSIDSDGNGKINLPFTNVANFYPYYEPTFGVFELKNAGVTIARSPSLYIGSSVWQDVNLDIPLSPISNVRNWEMMD